jgi:hypothetical protein
MGGDFKYEWGEEISVAIFAPEAMRPGRRGSVCGMRGINNCNLYLVEFSDGWATEIPEDFLLQD